MQGRNSQRTYNELYSNAMFQFKILKLLCLQFICLTNKFKALHSQEIFSESEIILCHNFSLKGQYIASQKIEKTCRLQFAAYSITSKTYLQGGWLGLAAVRTLLMVCMAAMPDQIELWRVKRKLFLKMPMTWNFRQVFVHCIPNIARSNITSLINILYVWFTFNYTKPGVLKFEFMSTIKL